MDLKEYNIIKSNDVIIRHPWELARLVIIKNNIKKHIHFKKNTCVLDIGCGDLYISEELANDYPDVLFYAVDNAFTKDDISNHYLKLNKNNLYLFSSLDEVHLPENLSFSLVLLTDVLEHIEDDVAFLKNLVKINGINDDTKFIITVPAFNYLFSTHDKFLGHYRRYTNKTLKEVLESANLKVVEIGYFFVMLLPIRWFQVLKEKLLKLENTKNSTNLTTWSGGYLITNILKKTLILDYKISNFLKKLKIKLPGLSNYCICKKHV